MEGGGRERTHEAADSALGYLYQSDLALLELLQRSKTEPALGVSIELLDDVAFEEAGTATELLQAKHRLRSQGSLSDASSDLWKTLDVWMDALESRSIDLGTTRFSIATTGNAPDGSAASLLRLESRSPQRALEIFERTARTSANVAHAPIYEKFLNLQPESRAALVAAITVYDGSPSVVDIPGALQLEVRFASELRFRQALVERLLGWWHRRVLRHLLDRDTIFAEEIEREIDALRDQFKADNLPIDIMREDADRSSLSAEDRTFVRQLELIAATLPTIEVAIRNYKRAFLQRSRWLSDQLVTDAELHAYEERLIDEWQNQFAYLSSAVSSEEGLSQAGLELYHILQDRDLWIRPRCQERFVSRGSYHALADRLKVGWHPEFVARLRSLLQQSET